MSSDKADGLSSGETLKMTADVVSAYVGNNVVPPGQLTEIISAVHNTLLNLDNSGSGKGNNEQAPAVPIRKSVTPGYIVCLEDGKKLKMLKRHLRTTYNLTPEEYRARWGLPVDYPMVAPNYAKQRSEFAKKIGLGLGSKGRRKKS